MVEISLGELNPKETCVELYNRFMVRIKPSLMPHHIGNILHFA
jgi:hypothetical protein